MDNRTGRSKGQEVWEEQEAARKHTEGEKEKLKKEDEERVRHAIEKEEREEEERRSKYQERMRLDSRITPLRCFKSLINTNLERTDSWNKWRNASYNGSQLESTMPSQESRTRQRKRTRTTKANQSKYILANRKYIPPWLQMYLFWGITYLMPTVPIAGN